MFASLWRTIRHLFLPPMALDQEPLYFLTGRTQEFTPSHFYNLVCDAPSAQRGQYNVTKIDWYKQPRSISEHEFLVAELKRIDTSGDRVYYAVIERGPDKNASSKQVLKTSSASFSSSSNEEILPHDTIRWFDLEGKRQVITTRQANHLQTYKFTKTFPLLEFGRLVCKVSDHGPYALNDRMCYWFAAMVVDVIMDVFSNGRGRHPSGAGMFKGTKVMGKVEEWPKEVDEIKGEYTTARDADPDPVQHWVAEERRNAAEREARMREEAEEREVRLREEAEEREVRLREAEEREMRLREEMEEADRQIGWLQDQLRAQR